jgi:aminoglycoside 6'-N-acetyltransferase I
MIAHVRAAKPGDRDELLRMRRALWPDCPDEEHRAEIGALLDPDGGSPPTSCADSTGGYAAFVAERPGGGLCGFLEASIRPFAEGVEARPVVYIEGWYVDADVRRNGVGRALVEAAEAWARSKGCRTMASDALIDNAVSIEAHARLGYHEVERLVHFAKDLG